MEERETPALAAQEEPLSEETTTVKDFNQKLREVQLGISDTMPDGTPLSEIHERNRQKLEEQDQALLDLENERIENATTVEHPETAKPAEGLDPDTEITVRTLADGTTVLEVSADEIEEQDLTGDNSGDSDAGDGSDIPADYPGRKQLIAAGHVDYSTVAGFTAEHLEGIKGIGPALSDKIVAFNEGLKGGS